MYVEFSELPQHSRVWIYQSNRKFSDDETEEIIKKTRRFVENWAAHGSQLTAGFEVKYNRFIILAIDQTQTQASGCSIDASVEFIQSIEKEYQVDLLDKMNVTYYSGPYIAHKTLLEFKKMVKNKAVSPNTIVFNNLVTTKEEYESYWEIPASESWHARFM